MSIEDDLRTLLRDVVRLAIRDEVPGLLRQYVESALPREWDTVSRGDALSTSAAAAYVGVSPATIRGWVSSGQLRAQHAGRLLRIRRGDLDAFLARAEARGDGVIDLSERANEILSGKKRSRE